MRPILCVGVAALLAIPMVTQARVIPEVRPFAGALIPTGDQRDVFKDALLVGTQVAVEAADRLHVVGTFAFAGPDYATVSPRGHLHVYQVDVGGELFQNVALNADWKFRPFLGAGAGVRQYDPTAKGDTKNYATGFGALGAEFQMSRAALRVEARDSLTRFKGPAGTDAASNRNEVALTAGLAWHLR